MGQIVRETPMAPIPRDDRGRWRDPHCTYRGDKLDTCEGMFKGAERDAAGRIVAVLVDDGRISVTYDALDRVASVGDMKYRYDSRGFLVGDDDLVVDVDAHGRVLTVTRPATPPPPPDPNSEIDEGPSEAQVTTYSYEGDRLVKVETPASYDHIDLGYDGQGRLTRVRWAHLEDEHTREFGYDCK